MLSYADDYDDSESEDDDSNTNRHNLIGVYDNYYPASMT